MKSAIRSSSRATRAPPMDVSTTAARQSRLKSSLTARPARWRHAAAAALPRPAARPPAPARRAYPPRPAPPPSPPPTPSPRCAGPPCQKRGDGGAVGVERMARDGGDLDEVMAGAAKKSEFPCSFPVNRHNPANRPRPEQASPNKRTRHMPLKSPGNLTAKRHVEPEQKWLAVLADECEPVSTRTVDLPSMSRKDHATR